MKLAIPVIATTNRGKNITLACINTHTVSCPLTAFTRCTLARSSWAAVHLLEKKEILAPLFLLASATTHQAAAVEVEVAMAEERSLLFHP
jgi:hypothetical protein